ncbi:MAG: HAD family acid phosphatase [Candidatus Hydrogenedentota bacterium]
MIIVNIDDTIADTQHRLKRNPDGSFDWDYYDTPELIEKDPPIKYSKEILFKLSLRHPLVFLSSRQEKLRDVTIKWLNKNGFSKWVKLYMRSNGDKRTRLHYKSDIFKKIIEHSRESINLFDDQEELEDECKRFGIYFFKAPECWNELIKYISLL